MLVSVRKTRSKVLSLFRIDQCYNCGGIGHYSRICPSRSTFDLSKFIKSREKDVETVKFLAIQLTAVKSVKRLKDLEEGDV